MLRSFVLLLILANLAFYAWSHGYLRAAGLGPHDVAEPQRLTQQIHPERLVIAAPESGASAPASSPASGATSAASAPAPPSAASAAKPAASNAVSAAAGPKLCLQVGPYLTAGPEVGAALRAAGLAPVEKQQALGPQWMVFMGPYPDAAALKSKLAELQRLELKEGSYGAVTDRPRYMPGISLGILPTQAAAQQQLKLMQAKGVKSAQVVPRNAGMSAVVWVLDGLTPAQAATLRRLDPALLKDQKPQACKTG
ncbi:MAG: hypothetical protein B7X31_04305 [Thiomonas sp. 13-66-29]|jgi:pyruvate/2-oxoglutarate dehydrogenase complex dihydrolipoamide acyltransferase (E2) component|nr:MAG: hypothetical protein B7X31_04305 [Thiomonas sp. 13-66-29]